MQQLANSLSITQQQPSTLTSIDSVDLDLRLATSHAVDQPHLMLSLSNANSIDGAFLPIDQPYLANSWNAQLDNSSAIPLDVLSSTNQIFLSNLSHQMSCSRPLKEGNNEFELKICRKQVNCVICQELVKRKSVIFKLNCQHVFHRECLQKWSKKNMTCPLCRKQLK